MSRRPRRLIAIVAGVIAFLAISVGLARWLNTETNERDAVYGLLKAQARGDAPAMLRDLSGCGSRPACRALAFANARTLRRAGTVKIIAYDSKTSYALGSARGRTRVAWTVPQHGLPVVQCVLVKRTGNALFGRAVSLLELSRPIDRQGTC